jgi:putative hemolysin
MIMLLPLAWPDARSSRSRRMPPPPKTIGMANPASVYCQQGGS